MQFGELIAYDTILDAAWTKLSRAANDPAHMLRLMAVATVAPDGKPSNRTLVLRGADRASGIVWFHTDRRSPKVLHLMQRPCISALGYDGHDQVQIRLDGPVTLHQDDALAEHQWQQVSMALRFAYAFPHAPGRLLKQPDPRLQKMQVEHDAGESERGRENFVVIQVRVEVIDWLQISHTRQRRAILRAGKGWKSEPLVP